MKTSIQIGGEHALDMAFLKNLKASGFDGVDLFLKNNYLDREDRDNMVDTICSNLNEAGLTCAQVHLPYYGMMFSSELFDDAMEARIHYVLSIMPKLGAKWGALHAMSSTNYGFDRKRAMEDNIVKLQNYLKTAEKYDVGIAVENLPVWYDVPQNAYFTSEVEDHVQLIDRLNHPLIGACWDFGHANIMGCDQFGRPVEPYYDKVKALETMGKRVKIVHAQDNYGDYDEHHCPTIGTVEWYKLIPILLKNDFPGYFSLEVEMPFKNRQMLDAYMELCGATARALVDEIEALEREE
ncbi:MAG: sugar phosphate isomerase/epimerase [Lachnospiraceae bacterium]|nr:sugar phosphate isomerase/epimerase [Lachnospiraceae bacterium]